MGLFVAGVNPRRPVFPSASQHLADAAARRALLGAVSGHRSLSEGLLVAADGRLELYAVADEGCDAYDIAAGLFGAVAEGEVAGALYFAEGIDAASHLFAALCGLDEFARGPREGASLPGECDGLAAAGELSQPGGRGALGAPGLPDALAACWARALSEARKAATLGDALTRLAAAVSGLSSALSAADASASTAALAETAVELARRVFGHLERRCVLAAGVERFQVLCDGDCEEAARVLGAPVADPQLLSALLVDADIVLAESAVEGASLDRRLMKGVVRLRRGRPMLLVDASADGSLIDHRVASLDGVFLYAVADLAAITRDAPWARLGTDDARERLFADAVRAFALQMG
ncbi:hypothetical protein [Adlercreutzia equolifaciens]|uniref:hypothetical protein n=1 Tax=Adlercreutzia equolifaciens TaxID=446660 RepID=UPI001EDCF103|nr:hypothetical protein [Adlercreutzia equolifaciens]MCG4825366.1 hypothetical protein [Adlercreutzia equolifaciens]